MAVCDKGEVFKEMIWLLVSVIAGLVILLGLTIWLLVATLHDVKSEPPHGGDDDI